MDKLFTCPICEKEPGSHSFLELSCDNATGSRIFYTCPATATKYDDYDGIMLHYDGMLSQNGDAPWIWIFDSKGFSTKHLLEIRVGIGLAKLISTKYSHNLKKICIINANKYVFIAHNVVQHFLPQKVKDVIVICPQ
jgi:hypothetical protein